MATWLNQHGLLGQRRNSGLFCCPFFGALETLLAAGKQLLHNFKSEVNSFRQFLMQTTFKAVSLFDETVHQAEVVTAFLVIAGKGLLCQQNLIHTSILIISLMPALVRGLLLGREIGFLWPLILFS